VETNKTSVTFNNEIANLLQSDQLVCCDLSRRCAASVLLSRYFDFAIGMVILLNSVIIGLEQSYRIDGKSTAVWETFEHCFLVIYILELGCRFFVVGIKALNDNWVVFDCFLVVTSIITQWVVSPILGGEKVDNMSPLMVMKIARLARLARALRLLKKFRHLWMLVRGLLHSLTMINSTLVLLSITLYMFACIGSELITLDGSYTKGSDDAYNSVVTKYFASLFLTMLTLVQFVALDDTSQIYRPMILARPVLLLYFGTLILIVAILIMNVVTAVLVNGALEQANEDKETQVAEKEAKKGTLLKALHDMFERMDEDKSGKLTRDELVSASQKDKDFFHEFLELKDPVEVFDQLDVDSTGTVEVDEFVDGLYDSVVSRTPIILKRIDKRMDTMKRHQDATATCLSQLQDKINLLMMRLQPENAQAQMVSPLDSDEIDQDDQSQVGLNDADAFAKPFPVGTDAPPSKPLVMKSPCAQAGVVNYPEASFGTPAWADDMLIELRRIRLSLDDGRGCRALPTPPSTSAYHVGNAVVPHVVGNCLKTAGGKEPISVFRAALRKDDSVCIEMPQAGNQTRTKSPDTIRIAGTVISTDRMSAPIGSDSFGVAESHNVPSKIRAASRKPNQEEPSEKKTAACLQAARSSKRAGSPLKSVKSANPCF